MEITMLALRVIKPAKASFFDIYFLKSIQVVVLLLLLSNAKLSFAQTPFTASWPLTTDLTGTKTGNVNANTASYTSGVGGLFTGAIIYTATGLNGVGISGRGTPNCDASYNSVTASCSGAIGSINPYMEFVLAPVIGNEMLVNSLTFTVSAPNATTSGRVVAAGYSVDGGTTFVGFTPTATSGATANTSPMSSTFSISSATTFSYTLPSAATVGNGSSLKIRILIWRNNGGGTAACSGSSSGTFTIGTVSVAGNTQVSNAPIAPTLGNLIVPSPKVSNDPDFTLTDPTSTSSGSFSYTSSDAAVATINGKTVSVKGAGLITITATQAANGAYASGSTTANLIVLPAPETPIAQTIPYAQDFGAAAFTELPGGLVAWNTSVNYTSKADAESSSPYTKATVTAQTTTLTTSVTPVGVIYGYAVPDPITNITNASAGFLLKSANSPQIALALNTIGKANINLKFDITVQKIGALDAVETQFRIGNSGVWTTLAGSAPDCSSLGVKSISADLPAICNNQPYVQLRWISWYSSATSCIFTLDNIVATSQNAVISLPLATNITHQSATLGATISDQAREISARGTVFNIQTGVSASDNALAEGATTLGTYAHVRSNLSPETQYYFKGYGVTSSQTFLTDETGFRTLSSPVLTATTNHIATAVSNNQINLSWTSASFPVAGATAKGYVVIRSIYPVVPALSNTNGANASPDANTIIVSTLSSDAVSLNVISLNSFIRYNFKIIPFTWDGVNYSTRNYLSNGAIFDATTFSGPVSIGTAPITNITSTSVSTGGTAVNDGGGVISAKGVVWGINANPTIADNKLEFGSGTSDFVSPISNLLPQTLYYTRAYAVNNAGVGYGSNVSFRTISSPTTTQASNLTAVGNNSSTTKIDFSWSAATFPSTGATGKGYALIYAIAPNLPILQNTNGQSLLAGPNTTILNPNIVSTATSFSVSNLPNQVSYNFLLVPFTWDGSNISTYNYLYATAPKFTSIKLPVLTASGIISFCKGGEVTLNSDAPTGNTWLKDGLVITGATATTYKAVESGLYTVRTSLTSTSVPILVTVYALPKPGITSTNGNVVSKGYSTQLIAGDGVSYLWSPAYRISDAKISNPVVQPDVTTTYTVTVTNANGCTATESITIEVVQDYKINFQTLLTPNGDGKNDVWVIKNIESYPDNEVKVYDQSGREVFRKKRYNNSWDGTFDGAYLPKGTYPYVIYFGVDQNIVKGYLTILR